MTTPQAILREATLKDAEVILPNLRPEDRRELLVSTHEDGLLGVLQTGIHASKPALTILVEDEVAGVLGVVPPGFPHDQANVACIWMVATPAIELVTHQFLRTCQGIIDHFNDTYPHLMNSVDARNVTHVKWLQWCGFDFQDVEFRKDINTGDERLFLSFWRTPECVTPSQS